MVRMCVYVKMRIYHWPVVTAVWLMVTFITSYAVSVSTGDVYFFFPYISDTGAIPPESCIFGQMLTVGSVLMAVTMYLRYRQIALISDKIPLPISSKWNSLSLWFALLSCAGMSLVANFQEVAVFEVHCIGAFLAFGMGMINFLLQTRISYTLMKNVPDPSYVISKCTFFFRAGLSLFMAPLFFVSGVCGVISFLEFDGQHIYHWTPKNGGYLMHLYATFTEWTVAIFMLLYIATYTNEFKSLEFRGIEIVTKIK